MITTQAELRKAFWAEHPEYKKVKGKTQNDYDTKVRVSWVMFVDFMEKNKEISEKLAAKATL